MGLIWGIDLNKIGSKYAIDVIHEAFNNHLIMEVAGRKDGVLKIMPPLTIEDNTLLEGLQKVKVAIMKVIG